MEKEVLKEMIADMFRNDEITIEVSQDRFKTHIDIAVIIDGETVAVARG